MASAQVTVGALLLRLGPLLNDEAKTGARWTDKDRRDALNEAICLVQEQRPKKFAATVEVPLVAGAKQKLPEGYSCLLSVDCTADGSLINVSEERSDVFLNAVSGLSLGCTTAEGYAGPTSARISDTSDSVFYVEPPVPAGADTSVSVTAVPAVPCDDDAATIPCSVQAAVLEWALHRLYSFENSGPLALRKAQEHRAAFYELVQSGRVAQQRKAAEQDGVPSYEV